MAKALKQEIIRICGKDAKGHKVCQTFDVDTITFSPIKKLGKARKSAATATKKTKAKKAPARKAKAKRRSRCSCEDDE